MEPPYPVLDVLSLDKGLVLGALNSLLTDFSRLFFDIMKEREFTEITHIIILVVVLC